MNSRLQTFYDLFAGIGGFRLGLEHAGFSCIGGCEIDKYAREIYKKNFGVYPETADARQLDPSTIPDFDILAAGFPCQAFSVAGKRMGFTDTRGTLFFEIARIAKQKRPALLFLENVKGLLSNDSGRTFYTIINTLDELGYDVEWQCINGKYFLPQKRERVFIVGHAREKPTRKIFPIVEGYGMGKSDVSDGQQSTTINCLDATYYKGRSQHGQRPLIAMLANTKGNIKQRIQSRDDCWSIDSCSHKQAILDDTRFRMLTPTECERLQGFPDGWTEGVSDTQRYKMLGNAVMVPVVEYIAKLMVTKYN